MPDKQQIAANFSRSARDYEKHAVLQRQLADELFHQLTAYNLSRQRRDPESLEHIMESGQLAAILDIGCGTGYLAFKLAKHFPGAQVLGIDIAPGMVEVAKNRYRAKNLVFEIADGEKLKLPPSFDLIVSNASLQWMKAETVFKNARKLLPADGRFIFNTFGPRTLIEMRNCGFRVNDFPAIDEIKKSLDSKFKILSLGSRKIKQKFKSVKELVYHLKELGAQATDNRSRENQSSLSSLKRYKSLYGEKGAVPATFEIISAHVII